jgi:hypothetical protein
MFRRGRERVRTEGRKGRKEGVGGKWLRGDALGYRLAANGAFYKGPLHLTGGVEMLWLAPLDLIVVGVRVALGR